MLQPATFITTVNAMSKQYIYTISELTKKHGPREVLKEVYLAFYPGAKIGVLGRNGTGKSTLLRIMAGQDTEFDGEARAGDMTHGACELRASLGFQFVEVARGQATICRRHRLTTAANRPGDHRELIDRVASCVVAVQTGTDLQVHKEVERFAQR